MCKSNFKDYHIFKIVLIGDMSVGKTCLIRKFTEGIFTTNKATVGTDVMFKTINVNGNKIDLQIWDTAGQEQYRTVIRQHYRAAHAYILVYDVSDRKTFDCINEWINEIEENADNENALRILVGNKVDKEEERQVLTCVGEAFARTNNFDYFVETSAASSENVEVLFQEVATRLEKVKSEMIEDERTDNRHNNNEAIVLKNESGPKSNDRSKSGCSC